MDKQSIHNLLVDYVSNQVDADGYEKLMDLILASSEDAELYSFMERVWNSRDIAHPFSELQSKLLYQRIIRDKRFSDPKIQAIPVVRKLWYRATIAAAVLVILSIGAFFFVQRTAVLKHESDHLTANDIEPGGNKAILTLGNGRKIILNDAGLGTLAEQGGITISKTADGKLIYNLAATPDAVAKGKTDRKDIYNTIATPKGGQYQVNLPDGTSVWLNSASSLKFSTAFKSQHKREVELTGEAYFEVAHDQKKPFVVVTRGQEVEVLGTHFNINSYADEPEVKTTLVKGRVRVSPTQKGHSIKLNPAILKPGEQAVLTANEMTLKTVDLESVIAWKKGYFLMKDEDIFSVMRKIERWYDVEIVYAGDFSGSTFEGSVSRFKNVSEILRKFELTGNMHFKIEGRRITVMP
ncbi:FecR family protein [Pedobacter sp. MC2016-24]|uniref:FecR family protein n=1 Tax=Pedobacter sp. MC2016-24 TaxID=2780090 RepID=UPI00188045EA|nr:FecR family protein [Pedobacter sp. MC2016-24]MBE9602182.1 FecR domain-containing protein [Pedobacter sp. MC2016-24]